MARDDIFLFGGTSMLGWSLLRYVADPRWVPFCSTHTPTRITRQWRRLDLEDEDAIARLFDEQQPSLLIHCGAVCNVDRCEADPQFTWAVNVHSIERLLRHLPPSTRLVYCSSDHVFGGGPQPFTERSPPCPISVYGQTRVAAEQQILDARRDTLVVRTSLAIGPSIDGRRGHLDWLRYRTRRRLPTTIVVDEHRSVTWAAPLAERVWQLASSAHTGLRHVAAPATSRWDLARYLNRRLEIGATLKPSCRLEQPVPHLGRVELHTALNDPLATPLPGVVPLSTSNSREWDHHGNPLAHLSPPNPAAQ